MSILFHCITCNDERYDGYEDKTLRFFILHDITDVQKSKLELDRSVEREQDLEDIIESSCDGIYHFEWQGLAW